MNKGTVLAVTIVAAYMGVEIFAFQKVSHRTKPTYIHNLLIETRTAASICNSDVAALSDRFDRTLARVSKKLKEEIQDNNPGSSSADIDLQIAGQRQIAQQGIRESLASAGCASQEMKDHLVRYRIYAKKSRG